MAETSPQSTSKAKAGKKKNLYVYGGVAVVALLAYYLYHKYSSSSSSGTAAANALPATQIDPLTGQPYAAGVGSLAPGASSGASSGSSAIDPNTGQPYATELAAAQATNTANQSLFTQLENDINALPGMAYLTGGTSPTPTQTPTVTPTTTSNAPSANAVLDSWRTEKAAVIAKAEHLTQAQAGQAISQYLQGKPITNAAAARGIANVVHNSGPAPTPHGAKLPIRVARTSTLSRQAQTTALHARG